MCTETPFSCARQRSLMCLAVLQLRHGSRSCDAAPELSAEEGSDPPDSIPRSASRRVGMCTPMPPSPAGSLPSRYPCRKAIERRCEHGGSLNRTGLRSRLSLARQSRPTRLASGLDQARPLARRSAGIRGVRGGTALRQPLPGTRGAWPQRVCWLMTGNGS